jgi:hypothetical protein
MSKNIYLYKNKQKHAIPSLIDWENPSFQGKDFAEAMHFLGYSRSSCLDLGFEFPWFEVHAWSPSRERANPYDFYGVLSLSDYYEDIVFENSLDLLEFLNHYAPAFDLLNRNFMYQVAFDETNEHRD